MEVRDTGLVISISLPPFPLFGNFGNPNSWLMFFQPESKHFAIHCCILCHPFYATWHCYLWNEYGMFFLPSKHWQARPPCHDLYGRLAQTNHADFFATSFIALPIVRTQPKLDSIRLVLTIQERPAYIIITALPDIHNSCWR